MDISTVVAGIAVVGLGIFFLARSLTPHAAFGKLKAMMEFWGEKRGVWLYRTFYVGIPCALGGTMIVAGYNGATLAQYFRV